MMLDVALVGARCTGCSKPITYEATGIVKRVEAPISSVRAGDVYSFIFTLDGTAAPESTIATEAKYRDAIVGNWSLTIGSYSATGTASGDHRTRVQNGVPDFFETTLLGSATSLPPLDGVAFSRGAAVYLDDGTGTTFSDTSIPSLESGLEPFMTASFVFFFGTGSVVGQLTDLSVVVPK